MYSTLKYTTVSTYIYMFYKQNKKVNFFKEII